ncbi:MAG: PqiC family protein [Myxococcota bacterium]|nr:PqiC family protein [Myxococcota bacterium]
MRSWTGCGVAVAICLQCGCALTSKSDAMVARYFTPESSVAAAEPTTTGALELRLGRVNSASYIKDKIVFRESPYEVGYYEGKRWTEKPETYVRRALTRALFERRGIRQLVFGAGSTLDVDVIAFEEVRVPTHVGRVQLTYSLSDDRVVRLAGSVTVERPIAGATTEGAADAIVQALSVALADSVDLVAEKAVAELRAEVAPPKSASSPDPAAGGAASTTP